MIILDLLPSNHCEHDMCFSVERRCLYASSLYNVCLKSMSKLSTKDLLALASMKNVAKREM
jgi:hypothetical protein